MENVVLGIAIGMLAFVALCTCMCVVCVGVVVGFKNSTHQVSYVNPFEKEWEDEQEVEDDFNPFAMKKEDMEKKEETPFGHGLPKNAEEAQEFAEKRQQWMKKQRELEEAMIGSENDSMLR